MEDYQLLIPSFLVCTYGEILLQTLSVGTTTYLKCKEDIYSLPIKIKHT